MRRPLFSHCHPAVLFLYFFGAAALAMCTTNPLFVAVSLLCGTGYRFFLAGGRSVLKSLLFSLPALLLIAGFNALSGGLGLTVLFYLGETPVTAESLCYGLCMGGMLLSVLQWFACYQAAAGGDKLLSLFGRFLPTLSLMLSMICRYIPDTFRMAGEIRTAQTALLGAEPPGFRARLRRAARLSSVLVGWSLENALETARAMQAKGYAAGRRTRYDQERLSHGDAALFLLLLFLLLASGYAVLVPAAAFSFYPLLTSPTGGWWCLPYALFLLLPLFLEGRDWLRCRR